VRLLADCQPDAPTRPADLPEDPVLNNELDSATPYEGALNSVKHLPGAQLISVDNEGSHGVFPYHTTCVDDPVDAYFLSGAMPQDQYNPLLGHAAARREPDLPGRRRQHREEGREHEQGRHR